MVPVTGRRRVLHAGATAAITVLALPRAAAATSLGSGGDPQASSLQVVLTEGDGEFSLSLYEGG
jgi:hypothetical protein